MYRQLSGLLMLPLLLGSVLISSNVTASPRPNLCPGKDHGGEGLEIYAPRLKFYAETKDRYINVCATNEVSAAFFYVSRLKSGGNTVVIPVWKVEYGWISKNPRSYTYELSAFSTTPKLTISKEGKLIFNQNLLSNAASYPN